MPHPITIGRRRVGPGEPVYVVAEMSANHLGDFDRAMRIVEAAAGAGADAVKLQTYTPGSMTLRLDRPWFRVGKGTPWEGRALHDLYAEAMTPWEWQPRLKEAAARLGIDCFSSPFDAEAVAFLEKMGVPAYKIASFEIGDLDLIRCAAATGKPVILSTGMATAEEIAGAVAAARGAGSGGVALLKCTSAYPAPPEEMNLRTIPDMAARFDAVAGLSDHTPGHAVAVAAVALGASLIEKHLTLARADGGPDGSFSMEPAELRALVEAVRAAERSLGAPRYGPTGGEEASRVFRRSLFVVRRVAAGEPFTRENVRAIRPGDGLAPKHLPEILGRKAARDVEEGTPMGWNLLEGAPPAGGRG